MTKLKRGYVHVYTGNGKGKTTAALGLALRASGAGLKVYIQQFAKNRDCCAIKALKRIKNITVNQCGNQALIIGKPKAMDLMCAKKGLVKVRKNIFSNKYDLVILDEINVAMKLGLVKTRDVIEIIKLKPGQIELVLTGRNCPASIIKLADLITDMREIRHPYHRGIKARRGIEY